MSVDLRLMAYAPNGAALGELAGARSIKASNSLSQSTAVSWEQPMDSAGAPRVQTPIEVQPQVRKNGGGWRDFGSRCDLVMTDGDRLAADQALKCEALTMWDRLASAVVYGTVPVRDIGEPATVESRVFEAQTAQQIMSTLLSEERGRGRLTAITLASPGGALPTVDKIEFGHGTTLDVALQALCDRGACQAHWAGKTLTLYPVGIRNDRTVGTTPVLLTIGRDLLDAPVKVSREGAANVAMVRGDHGVTVEVAYGPVPPFGPAVVSVDAPGISDTASLNAIGTAELARLNRERTEWTAGLNLNPDRNDHPAPYVDYSLGDRVLVRLSGTETVAQQVVQIILETDKMGVANGAVVLGDKIPSYEARTAREQRMARSGLVPARGSLGDGLGKQPADYLGPNFDAGKLPWNDAWGDMPSTGAGEPTDCAPSCDCRAPRYPMQIGKKSIGSGIFYSSGSYGGRILSVVDHVGINGHTHRANWDPIQLQYQHPDHDTLREGSLAVVTATIAIVQGLIRPGEEDDVVGWLTGVSRPDVVYQKNYEWAIHDEIHVHQDFAGSHASYPVAFSSGGAGAAHAHRTALVLSSTYMDPDVYGGLFHFAPITYGVPKLIIDDLGPD